MSKETSKSKKNKGKKLDTPAKAVADESDMSDIPAEFDTLSTPSWKNPPEPDKTSQIWLISFTDIFALLITFFVMLFSMSTPKIDAWTDMVTGLDAEFHNKYGGEGYAGQHASQENNRAQIIEGRGLDIGYLRAVLEHQISQNELLATNLKITNYNQSEIVISLPESLLFAAGQAEILEEGQKAFTTIGKVFAGLRNPIEIYGHTDPNPVEKSPFPSNWGLSLARAVSTAQLLKDMGYRKDVSIMGLADKKFSAIDPNLPQEERYTQARRVEILIRDLSPQNEWDVQ